MASIREEVRRFILEEIAKNRLSDSELSDSQDLGKKGIVDSIALMRLLTFLTAKFGFELKDDDYKMDYFESVNSIVRFVEKKRN